MFFSNVYTLQILSLTLFWCVSHHTLAAVANNHGNPWQNYTNDEEPILSGRRWKRAASLLNKARNMILGETTERGGCYPELIQSVVTYPGESLVLKCAPCREASQTSMWKIRLQGSDEEVKLKDLDIPEVVREGATDIAITEVSAELAGRYTCFFAGKPKGYYEVTVRTLPDFEVVFTTDSPDESPTSKFYYEWGTWTRCSAPECEAQGEHIKIGMCYQKVDEEQFPSWVPCKSLVATQSSSGPTDRKDKKMIRGCKMRCIDRLGKNDALQETMPALPPLVTQEALFPIAGETIALSCSSISVVAYARWEKDGVMIKQVELYQDENPRVSIDAFHTLHIRNVEKEDEGEYTCWHNSVQHLNYKIILTASPMNTEKAESGMRWTGIVISVLVIIVIVITVLKLRKCGKC